MEKVTFIGFGIGVSGLLTWLGIDSMSFYLFMGIVAIDLLTGVIKGFIYKNLASGTFISGIFKKTSLLLLILSTAMGIKILGYDSKLYMDIIFGALTGAELYSVLSNIYIINTGKKISEYSALEAVLGIFVNIVKNMVNDNVKEINTKQRNKKELNKTTNKEDK